MKEIELFDPEQQETFKLIVTEDNYDEIVLQGNLALATSLLQKQQEKENFVAAFNLIQNDVQEVSTSCASDKSNTGTVENIDMEAGETSATVIRGTGLATPESTKIWTDEATKYLINLCKKYEKEFEAGVKKYVWNKIARDLSEKCNQLYTTQQCDTKWKGLKNMYKQIKRHNEQSGNNRRIWKYFDLMDEILFSRPEINSKITCSSKTGLIINRTPSRNMEGTTSGQTDNDLEEEVHSDGQSTPRFHSSFMKKRRNIENAAERRHKEKMARQDRYLDLLDRLTTAVERSSNQSFENGNN